MLFGGLKYSFRVEGTMPERALLRLRRGGISLYKAQKIEKNALLFQVKKKDIEKVFAIYPNLCYNRDSYSPYKVQKIGGVGFAKVVDFCQNRLGATLGALLFCALILFADGFVFGVELCGSQVYRREALLALAECGVSPFSRYPDGAEKEATAKLLALQGVEFGSVQKIGNRVRVEMRVSPLKIEIPKGESMLASCDGEILSITALRGTPLKKAGDTVAAGEPLVGNWLEGKDGERIFIEPIARAQISCRYRCLYAGLSEEEAFAKAYLELQIADRGEIVEKSLTQTEEGTLVELSYLLTERVNM